MNLRHTQLGLGLSRPLLTTLVGGLVATASACQRGAPTLEWNDAIAFHQSLADRIEQPVDDERRVVPGESRSTRNLLYQIRLGHDAPPGISMPASVGAARAVG
jgi:hypothetical protein